MRKKMIAGNWKMNCTSTMATELINSIKDAANTAVCDVVVCVPFTAINASVKVAEGTKIIVSAQNIHFEDKGAYTGEISADMLLAEGVKTAVIGHSERRQYFAETDMSVNLKTIKCLQKGITPIVCVGECLSERQDGITFDIVAIQVKKAFKDISKQDAKKVVVAYEPIWAIGTGVVATDMQAEEVCAYIRTELEKIYDSEIADEMRILYGGSVNGKNASSLMNMPNIDGGLVGGASLNTDDFISIINSAK